MVSCSGSFKSSKEVNLAYAPVASRETERSQARVNRECASGSDIAIVGVVKGRANPPAHRVSSIVMILSYGLRPVAGVFTSTGRVNGGDPSVETWDRDGGVGSHAATPPLR